MPLEYANPPVVARFAWRRWVLLLTIATIFATLYWCSADWWAYVDEGNGKRWPKFKLPLWWQLIESSVIGVLATVGLRIFLWSFRRFIRRMTSRRTGAWLHHEAGDSQ